MWTRNYPRIEAMGGRTNVALLEFQASRAGHGSVSVETRVNGKGRQSRCSAKSAETKAPVGVRNPFVCCTCTGITLSQISSNTVSAPAKLRRFLEQ